LVHFVRSGAHRERGRSTHISMCKHEYGPREQPNAGRKQPDILLSANEMPLTHYITSCCLQDLTAGHGEGSGTDLAVANGTGSGSAVFVGSGSGEGTGFLVGKFL